MKAQKKLEKLREMKPDSLVFRLAEWTYKLAKKGKLWSVERESAAPPKPRQNSLRILLTMWY